MRGRFEIVHGPSAEELLSGLAEHGQDNEDVGFEFTGRSRLGDDFRLDVPLRSIVPTYPPDLSDPRNLGEFRFYKHRTDHRYTTPKTSWMGWYHGHEGRSSGVISRWAIVAQFALTLCEYDGSLREDMRYYDPKFHKD